MESWIKELWEQVRTADWGTKDLLDAVWDLCGVAETGLITGTELDRRLNERVTLELTALTKTPRRKMNWRWQSELPECVEEEAA